ncbi:piggyBac transposable element-derived protein 4-like [Ischnura elegans]|uniref:piggyBac transposable element-derived protein 4-like n=1 Tax=Ischnura elegans TaxID=197161 RepID=UPI001ED86761|nr:piggyBac transposable element-derived protein 4-like [Ischnura elegans]
MENLSAREIELALLEITDDQACNSDFGGDSDADDGDPVQSKRDCTAKKARKSIPVRLSPESMIPGTSGIQAKGKRKIEASTLKTVVEGESESDDSDYVPEDYSSDSSSVSVQSIRGKFSNSSESEPEGGVRIFDHDETEEFRWSKRGRDPKTFTDASFNQHIGPNIAPKDLHSPLAFLLHFITDAFLVEAVAQSNLYAEQHEQNLELTVEELKAWLGIIIFMGFHYLPSIRLFWSTDENFHCERVARIMSLNRFLKILRFLHINDNTKMPPRGSQNFDRLYKIRPLLNQLSETFPSAYSPSRFLSIDESMVAFKGRSTMKQYMPLKPIKRGFKVWLMCCAATGYLVSFDVYTGRDGDGCPAKGLGGKVVSKLIKGLEGLDSTGYKHSFSPALSPAVSVKGAPPKTGNSRGIPAPSRESDAELNWKNALDDASTALESKK